MSMRRGIIFAYLIYATFLMAHIINAVIAEALSVPVGPVRPLPAPSQETAVGTSLPVLVEHIRTSGLFPLPPDPLRVDIHGSGTSPLHAPLNPLNLASKLKLLGVVIGD